MCQSCQVYVDAKPYTSSDVTSSSDMTKPLRETYLTYSLNTFSWADRRRDLEIERILPFLRLQCILRIQAGPDQGLWGGDLPEVGPELLLWWFLFQPKHCFVSLTTFIRKRNVLMKAFPLCCFIAVARQQAGMFAWLTSRGQTITYSCLWTR